MCLHDIVHASLFTVLAHIVAYLLFIFKHFKSISACRTIFDECNLFCFVQGVEFISGYFVPESTNYTYQKLKVKDRYSLFIL